MGIETKARFDMEGIINHTKQDALVYDDLSHFIFNSLLKANSREGDFDVLNVYTWLTVFGWVVSILSLVLVVLLRFKVRSLTFLLMARGSHAASLSNNVPKVLTLTTTTPVTKPTVDFISEWVRHVSHVPNVLPVEILILLCLIMLFLFKVFCIIRKDRRQETARTRLVLEIGNGMADSVLLPIINLPHAPRFYRFVITKSDVDFLLMETNFSAQLCWNKGITFSNTALDLPIFLPARLKVNLWQVKKLKSLLQAPYFAVIQVVNGTTADLMDVVVLRTYGADSQGRTNTLQPLYPSIMYP